MEWSQAIDATGKSSLYIKEVLEAAFNKAQAVVVLMTPDENASQMTTQNAVPRLKPDRMSFSKQGWLWDTPLIVPFW